MGNRLIFGIIGLIFLGCQTSKSTQVKNDESTVKKGFCEVKNYTNLQSCKGDTAMVYGTIIREKFVNKGGRETDIIETLLKLEDSYKVHLRNLGSVKVNFDNLENKKVKLQAIIFYGGIDSDDPKVQSRIGYRIDYFAVESIND